MSSRKIFKTTNRKLEQFLYMHRITFISQRKGTGGLNEWHYIITPRFTKVYGEYRELYLDA